MLTLVEFSASGSTGQVGGRVNQNVNIPVSEPGKNFVASSVRAVLPCSFCQQWGHSELPCWHKSGCCLFCGGNDHLTKCRKLNSRHSKLTPSVPCVVVSTLGKHCGRGTDVGNHTEERCWLKQGCCLLCGSLCHSLTQCSQFVPRPLPVLSPGVLHGVAVCTWAQIVVVHMWSDKPCCTDVTCTNYNVLLNSMYTFL